MEKIKGYRELTADEIWVINSLKKLEGMVNSQINTLRVTEADQRCVAIAATHFETAFMYLTKSVAKPERVTDENMEAALQTTLKLHDEQQAKEEADAPVSGE